MDPAQAPTKPFVQDPLWRTLAIKKWGHRVEELAGCRVVSGGWMSYCKRRCSMRSIPQSPLSLIQELYTDPWQHLTCCLLCTRTTGGEAIRGAITTFLHLYPSPSAVLDEPREVLLEVIHPLGLQDMRLKAILAMSTDFLAKVGVFVKRDQHACTGMHSLARLHILLLGWPERAYSAMHALGTGAFGSFHCA